MVDEDLLAIGQPIPVRIRIVRVGADQVFHPIGQTVSIAIKGGIGRLPTINRTGQLAAQWLLRNL